MEGLSDVLALYSVEAEENVLGAILVKPELLDDCILKPEYFSPGRNENLFYTFRDLEAKRIPIDIVSIVERVGNKKVEKVGGVSYLSDLAGSIATTSNFNYHCQIVFDYYQKRQAIEVANKIKFDVADKENASEAIAEGIAALMGIEDGSIDDDDGDTVEALSTMYEGLETATGEITGIRTGFTELDNMTGGYKGGNFIVVAARPSVGKTAFAINKALNACKSPINKEGDVVALFSLEMGKVELLKRATSTVGHINSQLMKTAAKNFQANDWGKTTNAMGHIANSDFKIFDRGGVDVTYIWGKCRKLKRNYPGRRIMIIIDYLQLLKGPKAGSRQEEVGEISRSLKHMARELDIVVVALSQLSRGVEQRQDKRPMLSDIRESGQIEQDADIIQFLYRDDYYDKETENKNIIEVIVAKHRDGPTGLVSLAFVREYGKFVNLERKFDKEPG